MNKNKLLTMIKLQDEMNCLVDPDWRDKKREWYRAIWVECAEMLDHYGWKWWKRQQPDMAQVHLELVDIWHFGLSCVLEEYETYECTAVAMMTDTNYYVDSNPGFHDLVERMVEETLFHQSFMPSLFLQLMQSVGLTFDQLFNMYVGKNILNIFRQKHGYKDGTYIKVWDGREDNEHLVDIMNSLDMDDANLADTIYQRLEAVYPK